ncbi:MAG: hypothetical protein SGJ19_09040 [Planctomycetia bacterium]|nr:hypothetical protein [Planctomycetia bacterium]
MLSHSTVRPRFTRLAEAMAAGVYVEARDPAGHTIGQAVFTAWQGRPLPQVGDTMICPVLSPGYGPRKLAGEVSERRFEIQTDADGNPEVWVSMIVTVDESRESEFTPRVRGAKR